MQPGTYIYNSQFPFPISTNREPNSWSFSAYQRSVITTYLLMGVHVQLGGLNCNLGCRCYRPNERDSHSKLKFANAACRNKQQWTRDRIYTSVALFKKNIYVRKERSSIQTVRNDYGNSCSPQPIPLSFSLENGWAAVVPGNFHLELSSQWPRRYVGWAGLPIKTQFRQDVIRLDTMPFYVSLYISV